jgi:hypothetical protein
MNTNPAHQTFIDPPKTFADAAASYLKHGGSNRYLPAIIAYFGDRPLSTIFPFDIHEMAKAHYPHQKNSTRNRQALTPARAVMMHAYERGWCDLLRLRIIAIGDGDQAIFQISLAIVASKSPPAHQEEFERSHQLHSHQ